MSVSGKGLGASMTPPRTPRRLGGGGIEIPAGLPSAGFVILPGGPAQVTGRLPSPPTLLYPSSGHRSCMKCVQGAVEMADEVAFQGATNLTVGAAFLDASLDVGAGIGVVSHADHRDGVQCPVQTPVATPVESVSGPIPPGSRDRTHAGQGSKSGLIPNSVGAAGLCWISPVMRFFFAASCAVMSLILGTSRRASSRASLASNGSLRSRHRAIRASH
jgi:hypothetical protein